MGTQHCCAREMHQERNANSNISFPAFWKCCLLGSTGVLCVTCFRKGNYSDMFSRAGYQLSWFSEANGLVLKEQGRTRAWKTGSDHQFFYSLLLWPWTNYSHCLDISAPLLKSSHINISASQTNSMKSHCKVLWKYLHMTGKEQKLFKYCSPEGNKNTFH